MALETRDLKLLSHPFHAKAHKFVQGLPYIHEEVVNERLDAVDPSWSFIVKSISTRANAGEGGNDVATVTVHASLIIKGVARDGVGMAIVQKTKSGTAEANEGEKAATTDALKRCARMFGIGRYLLAIPKENGKTVVSDIRGLDSWLKKTYGNDYEKLADTPAYEDEQPARSLEVDDYIPPSKITEMPTSAWSEADISTFWNRWNKKEKLAKEIILKALGVNGLSEWGKSLSDANVAMQKYLNEAS